jgi:4'-phosphopantetheinyl transferase
LRLSFKETFPQTVLPTIKLEKREREFIIGRLLLHLVLPNCHLTTLPNGKPVVDGGWHVSFSHSLDLVGLVVAEIPVGLDIQVPDVKITHIQTKFCATKELEWIKNLSDPLAGATVIWSAKEAVFKVFGHEVDFAKDLITWVDAPDQTSFKVAYTGRHGASLFEMNQFEIQGARVVYTALLD